MTRRAMSRAEVREIDRKAIEEFGLPGVVLMENAGRGCAELLVSLGVAGENTPQLTPPSPERPQEMSGIRAATVT